eukprot:gnl/TRDRNA2_/TRDRNA2_174848_c8_seq2.p1 gnl/TRDRNA2_/TRDRNA2_174848_c8~~gnl/TRDRNA2_/TRDRNA2_174848_c8_seq2.p1  ORF type:complete len:312 (-),score=31.96 gnl/TRDRNA2_/TRDRNA2_174848_c8_seq2:340-1275(-)
MTRCTVSVSIFFMFAAVVSSIRFEDRWKGRPRGWRPAGLADVAPLHLNGSALPMPPIGFGTCCRDSSRGERLIESTNIFLANGGRLIDTAQMYGNHKDIAVAIKKQGVPRKDLWITSKVNTQNMKSQEDVETSVDTSLKELGLDYIDLMLLHAPIGSDLDVAFWKGLIKSQKSGKVKSIGVSNYSPRQIENIVNATGVTPSNNQILFNPWVGQETFDLVKWCQAKGITITAFGSFNTRTDVEKAVEIANVAKIVKSHNVSNAEVLLRWGLQKGIAVIPGATSKAHIVENLNVVNSKFRLSAQDLKSFPHRI